jgi:uncharacterized protein YwqG
VADELPTSPELFDLDELLAGLEPARREQAENLLIEALCSVDEDDEETVEKTAEASGRADRERPEQSPALVSAPSVELQQKMSAHAAQLVRDSGFLGDGSKPLSPEESMEAFMRITALLNSDQGMQKMLAQAVSPEDLARLSQRGGEVSQGEEGYSGLHKILGWPELVQGSVFVEAQYVTSGLEAGDHGPPDKEKEAAARAGIKDWRRLFQVDTDGYAEIMWGDAGTLYFLIKKDDLATGRFDNIWFSWQCH